MKNLLNILALVILLPTVAEAGEPRAHIDETLVRFVAAFNAGDGATVAGFYSEDATLFPPGGEPINGRSAIQTFWRGAIDAGMKLDDLHAVEVIPGGATASEMGIFALSAPGENGRTVMPGQYIVVWKRIGHTWQLHRDIWNLN